MRLLRRNTTEFEYFPPAGPASDVNELGEHTGDYSEAEFGEPVTYRGNISMPSGSATFTFVGIDRPYTHVLVMDKPDADIREGGRIRWKGVLYDVVAVRPSINAVSCALRRRIEEDEPVGTTSGGDG